MSKLALSLLALLIVAPTALASFRNGHYTDEGRCGIADVLGVSVTSCRVDLDVRWDVVSCDTPAAEPCVLAISGTASVESPLPTSLTVVDGSGSPIGLLCVAGTARTDCAFDFLATTPPIAAGGGRPLSYQARADQTPLVSGFATVVLIVEKDAMGVGGVR